MICARKLVATADALSTLSIYGGTVQVRGTGSLLHVSHLLSMYGSEVGSNKHEGVLLVQDGGVARSNSEVIIGRTAGLTGRAEVSGGGRLESPGF